MPVVAGDSGGAPETVRDGDTGRIVDGADVDEIATADQAKYSSTPTRAARWVRQGRRWAVDNWQWRSQADRLAALLKG